MQNGTVWELPFDQPAVLELQTEFGNLSLVPVEPGQATRLELSRGSENIDVHVDKQGEVVRVSLEPLQPFKWFGGWDCRAVLYVPRNVRAGLQTNAGSVSVRNLWQGSSSKLDKATAFSADVPRHGVVLVIIH